MSNIKNIERLQELLVLVAGVAVMLLIPFLGFERGIEEILISAVLVATIAFIVSGDAKKALMPVLTAFVKATPTTLDDELLEKIRAALPDAADPKKS